MQTDRPTSRAWRHNPLRVAIESEPGNREFIPDPRCAVEQLLIGSDGHVSNAIIRVWPGPTTPGKGGETALSPGDFLNAGRRDGFGTFLSCDQEIMVYRDKPCDVDEGTEPDAALTVEPIFSGYCEQPEYTEQAHEAGCTRAMTLVVEGPLSRLSDLATAQIVGRIMRTAEAEDLRTSEQGRDGTDAHGDETKLRTVPALPCVFNAGGKPNCSPSPITAHLGGETMAVSVFMQDNDPDAVPWTWAKVLRYLLYFYLYTNWQDGTGLIVDGDGFSKTETMQAQTPDDRPAAPASYDDAFTFAMLGKPSGFACEQMNVSEALILLADAAGIHFRVATELADGEDGEGNPIKLERPVNRVYFWPRGAGEIIELRAALDARPDADLSELDINALSVRMDYRDVLPAPMVFGDIRRYEITTELVPGWVADANLDNLSGDDIQSKTDYATEHHGLEPDEKPDDPWYQRYHRSGSLFHTYAHVGRRWILPTDGTYPPTTYARTVEPFTAARYALWEPSDCGITDTVIGADGGVETHTVEAGKWFRHRRPFLPCFSADTERRSYGIVVEVSFDSGTTWYRTSQLVTRALADDGAIYFDCEDLSKVSGPDEEEGDTQFSAGFWGAIISGMARVRVTCVIEGDLRVEPNISGGAWNTIVSGLSRQFNVEANYKSNRRDGGNSQYKTGAAKQSPAVVDDARDDIEGLQKHAEHLMEVCTARQQASAVRVPWLTTDYRPGQSVARISGLGLEYYAHATDEGRRYPDIVGVQYVGSSTLLALDDFRMLDEWKGSES